MPCQKVTRKYIAKPGQASTTPEIAKPMNPETQCSSGRIDEAKRGFVDPLAMKFCRRGADARRRDALSATRGRAGKNHVCDMAQCLAGARVGRHAQFFRQSNRAFTDSASRAYIGKNGVGRASGGL